MGIRRVAEATGITLLAFGLVVTLPYSLIGIGYWFWIKGKDKPNNKRKGTD